MLKSGLVSVSFRNLSCDGIIELAKESGLELIEWGGDVHVVPDNPENAEKVREKTYKAGLSVSSYGSYYKLNMYENYAEEFLKVLNTAKILGTDIIRIWAGTKGSRQTDGLTRSKMVCEAKEICDLARKENINVCFECHNNTLTDDRFSFVKLMKEINKENAGMYWQPNQFRSKEYNKKALEDVLPYLKAVHVFNWTKTDRFPLSEAENEWKYYFEQIKNKDCPCLLEFMPDDNQKSLKKEAKTLNGLLNSF